MNELVARIAGLLEARGAWLATAESCTGGLIASTLTDRSGSSAWFKGAVVSYTNGVKADVLAVPVDVLQTHGAVSEATVRAMVEGVRRLLQAEVAVAVSGIAGPLGGTAEKPVGTVWIAWSVDGRVDARRHRFDGDRLAVKRQTVEAALNGLADRLVVTSTS